ncbi:MAG: ComF family protein [Pyrinomonadaceae bacterium]
MFSTVTDKLRALLFPQACLVCRVNQSKFFDGNACSGCWSQTRLFTGEEAICEKCGLLLGQAKLNRTTNCWQCDGHFYEKARACGIYSQALTAEIVGLKTTPKLNCRTRELLHNTFVSARFHQSTLLIPVPLSRQRQFERGFNQAEVIANSLSHFSNIPVDSKSLQRTKHSTMHRIGMDRKARDLSVKNAFNVVRPKLIAGQNILLIDDVYTTGATLSYCAKALKKHGAVEVNALTIARAISNEV